MRWIAAACVIGLIGFAGFWLLTMPRPLDAAAIANAPGDPEAGRLVYFAGGCASCHKTPNQDDPLHLGGGFALKTPFGTFIAPNLSPHADAGVGAWSLADFANAMQRGIAPNGRHYYPAFPYTSYQRMTTTDIADLWAFILTLEPVDGVANDHDLGFPFNVRRGLGLWKRLYLNGQPFTPDPAATEVVNRGAYLVNGPGHCGECHTPRDAFGGPDPSRHLAGGPNPEGEGKIPNITPHGDGIGSWSESEIAYSLESGFTPEFDSFGGTMAAVVRNIAQLPASDREAIAAYLKTVPPLPDAK